MIGSFSFEEALTAEGIELRHVRARLDVRCSRTSSRRAKRGRYGGVDARGAPRDHPRTVQITTHSVHGAQLVLGKPEMIGIKDIGKPIPVSSGLAV